MNDVDKRKSLDIKAFAKELSEKLCGVGDAADCAALEITWDESDLLLYYTPLKEDLTPASFLKAKPVLDPKKCIGCGICKLCCPVGSIEGVAIENAKPASENARLTQENLRMKSSSLT